MSVRTAGAIVLLGLLVTPQLLRADTVQLSVHDGRVSIVADHATPTQILQVWSREGGVVIVNAEQMPATPLTLRLENIPEEQALEVLLRSVSGYLARRRVEPSPGGSVFDRIVIVATPAVARNATPPANTVPASGAPPVFPQPPRPVAAPAPAVAPAAPAGIPQAPGVTRLVGPDGQPVEDDQGGAPPPSPPNPNAQNPNAANPRSALPVPQPPPSAQPASPAPQPVQPPPPSTSAPAGVPRPGMVVPGTAQPGQPATSPGQPSVR